MNKVLFSQGSDDWQTPTAIYNYFVKVHGYKDLFPFKSKIDQFNIDYKNELLFCNPPFSKINKVVDYLKRQYDNNCNMWVLVPARTDTKWFHELLKMHPDVFFIKGRLKYNDKGSAPFPSVLLHINKSLSNKWHMLDFKLMGWY